MTRSTATTADEYLQELSAERRDVVAAVRQVVLRNLPAGYAETVRWGMLTYEIPLERHASTRNGQPLGYAAIAAQKSHFALYLMGATADPAHAAWIAEEFLKAGKKLDMGKSCLRFRRLDDLPLDVVGRSIASIPPERLIELHDGSA